MQIQMRFSIIAGTVEDSGSKRNLWVNSHSSVSALIPKPLGDQRFQFSNDAKVLGAQFQNIVAQLTLLTIIVVLVGAFIIQKVIYSLVVFSRVIGSGTSLHLGVHLGLTKPCLLLLQLLLLRVPLQGQEMYIIIYLHCLFNKILKHLQMLSQGCYRFSPVMLMYYLIMI